MNIEKLISVSFRLIETIEYKDSKPSLILEAIPANYANKQEKFDYLDKNRKHFFSYKILDEKTLDLHVVPLTIRSNGKKSGERFTQKVRENLENVIKTYTIEQVINIDYTDIKYVNENTYLNVLLNVDIDTANKTISQIPITEANSTKIKLVPFSLRGTVRTLISLTSSSNEDSEYVETLFQPYVHKETELIFIEEVGNLKPAVLDFWGLEPVGEPFNWTDINSRFKKVDNYSVFPLNLYIPKGVVDFQNFNKIKNRILKDINYIQYQHHYPNSAAHISLLPAILAVPVEKQQAAIKFLFEPKKSTNLRIDYKGSDKMLAPVKPQFVPKNGERLAGDRLMEFRSQTDIFMLAYTVTKLYNIINVRPEILGCRLVDEQIVPYIYTYNLYRDKGKELVQKYEYVLYTDVKKFFDTISFDLVHDAILQSVSPEHLDLARNLTQSLENVMCGEGKFNKLTIDSNYNHALSSIIMQYLINKARINSEFVSFVDDVLLFNDDKIMLQRDYLALEEVLKEYGMSLNNDKTATMSTKDKLAIKDLVFLPTALRYRVFDEHALELIKTTRSIGYSEFLKFNTKPDIYVTSSIEMFAKNFAYEEAKWVTEQYNEAMAQKIQFPPAEFEVLPYMQQKSLNLKNLTGDELLELMLMIDLYPSKQKWIISLLSDQENSLLKILRLHKKQYVRYLINNSIDEPESEPIFKGKLSIKFTGNMLDLDATVEHLLHNNYTNSVPHVNSKAQFDMVNDTLASNLYIVLDTVNKLFKISNNNPYQYQVYYKYWKSLIELNVNPFSDNIGLI